LFFYGRRSETNTEQAPEAATPVVQEAPATPLKGLLGTKIGMTRIFVDDTHMWRSRLFPRKGWWFRKSKPKATDGYEAVQVGYEDVLDRKLAKAEVTHFKKKNVSVKRHLHEFRVADASPYNLVRPFQFLDLRRAIS